MRKNGIFVGILLLLALCLGSCGTRTVDEMYSLPKRSSEFSNLQMVIDSAMNGLEYAAPVSGENRQSVQKADLNGDGTEELIVFAKGTSDSPLQLLIFKQLSDGRFRFSESVSCKGAAFEQVQYVDVDDKPGCEIVVGRRINDQITRIASIYSFASGQAEQLISTIYAKYITCDLNGDGMSELLAVRSGDIAGSNAIAVLYRYQDGVIERSVEAFLSETADQIKRITLNRLEDGTAAVYVASACNDIAVITDIFALKNDVLTNIPLSGDVGTSVQTLRNYYVYAEDIDSDGTLELPRLIPMRYTSGISNTTEQYLIRWYSMDVEGEETNKLFTFHNFGAGWYIELSSDWLSRVAVEENGGSSTFYMWNETYGEAMPVFSIHAFTGKDRDVQAVGQNLFLLHQGDTVTYSGRLESASAFYGITESDLIDHFRLIRQDWTAAEP